MVAILSRGRWVNAEVTSMRFSPHGFLYDTWRSPITYGRLTLIYGEQSTGSYGHIQIRCWWGSYQVGISLSVLMSWDKVGISLYGKVGKCPTSQLLWPHIIMISQLVNSVPPYVRKLHFIYKVVCTSSKCRWSIYRTTSKCRWSIYGTSRKHGGTLRVKHKVERSSDTVDMLDPVLMGHCMRRISQYLSS